MKFLTLAAALKLQTSVPEVNNGSVGVSPVRSDANSIVTILKQRYQRLRQASRPYHLLLQCMDKSIFKGSKLPLHVQSHVEKRKPGKEHEWDDQDWGNYIADRAADKDNHTLREKGFKVEIIEIRAKQVYADLLDDNQWYVGYRDGAPIFPHGILEHVHQTRHYSYIADRDKQRTEREEERKWYDKSLTYSA